MIYIGIGSNLGNRINYIEKAKYYLHINGINIIKSSRYYETLSWPDIRKPKFINIVIQTDTRFSPKRYLKIFKHIEKKLGRKKGKKNDPRTCDIDIISYDQKISIKSIKSLALSFLSLLSNTEQSASLQNLEVSGLPPLLPPIATLIIK